LLWTYSVWPHRIVALESPGCSAITDVNSDAYNLYGSRVRVVAETAIVGGRMSVWPFGPMRGGTPPVKLNESTYIGIFHSSSATLCDRGNGMMTYSMGAYLFSSRPPFAISAISRRPIVGSGEGFYNTTWVHRGTNFVVFPGSVHVSDDVITVFYGHQDRECWVARLNRTVLLSSMAHVRSTVSFHNMSYFEYLESASPC
jgi:predicted GH43/DUF377 family glycosyl hydrolase